LAYSLRADRLPNKKDSWEDKCVPDENEENARSDIHLMVDRYSFCIEGILS
jgi:hypothetical protein